MAHLCNGCYSMMQKCNKFKILLLFILKKVYTEFKFQYMSKYEARKLMENSNLIDKKGIL